MNNLVLRARLAVHTARVHDPSIDEPIESCFPVSQSSWQRRPQTDFAGFFKSLASEKLIRALRLHSNTSRVHAGALSILASTREQRSRSRIALAQPVIHDWQGRPAHTQGVAQPTFPQPPQPGRGPVTYPTCGCSNRQDCTCIVSRPDHGRNHDSSLRLPKHRLLLLAGDSASSVQGTWYSRRRATSATGTGTICCNKCNCLPARRPALSSRPCRRRYCRIWFMATSRHPVRL